jgi:hypothetical protein
MARRGVFVLIRTLLRIPGAAVAVAVTGFGFSILSGGIAVLGGGAATALSLTVALPSSILGAAVSFGGLVLLGILIATSPFSVKARLVGKPLQAERQPNGRRRLLRDLVVAVDGREITIPKGRDTDYSSIPWFARALVRWSRVDVAGVVHDHLYLTSKLRKSQADRVWRLVAMSGDHHANPLQAWLGYIGLLLGGWPAWWGHRLRARKRSPRRSGGAKE